MAVLILLALSGMPASSENKLRVVASIAPLADFAGQVGGDMVDVITLLPPGASPHTFEPTPKIIRQLSGGQIYVKIGAGLEFWADRLVQTANSRISTVECSEGIDLIGISNGKNITGPGHNADPHIWLDPLISIKIIRKIQYALSEADKPHADFYSRNASAYIDKLNALDREIAKEVSSFRTREFVTFHPGWYYFSRRYGLTIAGVIEEGAGKEPSPRHLGRLLKRLRQMHAKVIFAEFQFSPRAAEAIAETAGAEVLFLDPIGGQGKRKTYIDMMRYNLHVMKQAMK